MDDGIADCKAIMVLCKGNLQILLLCYESHLRANLHLARYTNKHSLVPVSIEYGVYPTCFP